MQNIDTIILKLTAKEITAVAKAIRFRQEYLADLEKSEERDFEMHSISNFASQMQAQIIALSNERRQQMDGLN